MNLDKLSGQIPQSVIDEIPGIITTFEINTPLRLSHFLAQCAEESGDFKYLKENLNYSAKGLKLTFPKYFPGDLANSYARKPIKIGNRVYANRMGNGDESSGDGFLYSGRGFFELTGKENYDLFSKAIKEDCIKNPDLVSTKYPLTSAAWFFYTNGLNKIADKGAGNDIVTLITKKINGGIKGLDVRIKEFTKFNSLIS